MNSVEIFGSTAEAFPFAKHGDLLLSLRNSSTLAVLDPRAEEITWAVRSGWRRQHAAVPTPDGTIRMFDNLGAYGPTGWSSRVIEIDPTTLDIVRAIDRIGKKAFKSEIMGDQHELANGNLMIVVSMKCRAVEVTESGQAVWELHPCRGRDGRQDSPLSGVLADVRPVDQRFVETVQSR